MFPSLVSIFATLLLALSCLVSAAPASLHPVQFLAVAPPVVYPSNGTTWERGSNQSVTWSTDNIPEEAQKYLVTILLGFLANGSENLDIKRPLAAQIPIMQGTAPVTVPTNLTAGNNYIVAVIGDSGNTSPAFTIQ